MKSNSPNLSTSLMGNQIFPYWTGMGNRLQFSQFWLFLLAFIAISSFSALAADSVVVQTFTWDSIICRQSTFKFPDKSEKFYKVIGRYRLKCDPKTQHDAFDCGEWDYHAYTRILNYPAAELLHGDVKFPTTTFGGMFLPEGGQTLDLTTVQHQDKYRLTYYKTDITSSNAIAHKVVTGDSSLGSYASHQFLIRSSDLTDAGLAHNDKIGQMVLSANIVDTMKNVIIRASQVDVNSITSYQMESYDTVAILQHITPEDCTDGKVKINFMKDIVWSDGYGIVLEILCSPTNNSANTFKGTFVTGRRANIGQPFSYAVFPLNAGNSGSDIPINNKNSWIDVDIPNIANELKSQFTIEAWVKINSADTASLNNAVLFAIGDKFVVRLGSNTQDGQNRTKIYIEKFNEENQINNSKADCIKYDQWHHVAVVFNGGGEISPDRLRLYVDGTNIPLWYQAWGINSGWAEANSYVHHFLDSTDANFTIGKGEFAIDTTKSIVNSNFAGMMSQIRLWSVALTEDNIKNNRYLTNITTADPNYNNLLVNLLCNETYAARTIANNSSKYSNATGRVIGDLYFDNATQGMAISYQSTRAFIPEIELITGDFTYNNVVEEMETTVEQVPVSLVEFNNAKTTYPAIKSITYYYRPWQFTYDINHKRIDSVQSNAIANPITAGADLYTYSKRVRTPWEVFEIGRYITPYGKGGLPIMNDGFEWEYDYTDYMHLLRDSVMLAVHNLQELIDLQFVFYKGEPIREVISVTEPWGPTVHSVLYKDLVENKSFAAEKEITLDANTKSVKLKTRITGHGMEQSTDQRQQCCEFYNNTHYLYSKVAGTEDWAQIKAWKIWRSCTENPVFPQGGTWFWAREGWCPGDAVQEYEHELTPYINNGIVNVKYGISDAAYKYDPKMGNGYYTMGLQLVQYGESKYKNDLELCKVIHPSTTDLYSRFNPICNGIELTVRNNSDVDVTGFNVEINATNPNDASHTITCTMPINRTIQPHSLYTTAPRIYLTAEEANNLWAVAATSSNPQITIKVTNPVNSNGTTDENPANNEITQAVKLPDIWNKNDVTIRYRTNNYPTYYQLSIYDCEGNNIRQMSGPNANANYQFKLDDLPDGCYTFEIENLPLNPGMYLGLSSAMRPDIGNGSIGFYSAGVSKALQPEFGRYMRYSFVLNRFTSIIEDEKIIASVYPNPTTNVLFIQSEENIPNAKFDIYDINGNVVFSTQQNISEKNNVELDVSALMTGTYQVRISNDKKVTWAKFIKE